MPNILQQFLSEDCDDGVRQLLLDTIAELNNSRDEVFREFTFNRFNIKLNFGASEVKLEDELDPSPEGEQFLPLDEFRGTLERSKGSVGKQRVPNGNNS